VRTPTSLRLSCPTYENKLLLRPHPLPLMRKVTHYCLTNPHSPLPTVLHLIPRDIIVPNYNVSPREITLLGETTLSLPRWFCQLPKGNSILKGDNPYQKTPPSPHQEVPSTPQGKPSPGNVPSPC
jgi:hypothetical protein